MIARYLRFPGGRAKALTFSYDDGTMIYNPSVRSVWICDGKGNTYEIKPGETIRA